MRTEIITILEQYLEAYKQNNQKNVAAVSLRDSLKNSIIKEAAINVDRYKVKGSSGAGNVAEIPWLCIFDRDITESAQHGYYIVLLFKANMKGFYISLNQGWTVYKNEYGTKEARVNIRKVSTSLKSKLNSLLSDFSFDEINLESENTLAKGYELAHICGKYYERNSLPSDNVLIDDIRNMVGVYRELKGYIGDTKYEEYIKNVVDENFTAINYNDTHVVDSSIAVKEIFQESFQEEIQNAIPASTPLVPQKRNGITYNNGTEEQWPRNPRIAKEAIEKGNYRCHISNLHITFDSSKNNKNFVEAHHLIPIKFQGDFTYSIDVPANIIPLCPNCHRKLHYGKYEEKSSNLSILLQERKNILMKYGIKIDREKLLSYYK